MISTTFTSPFDAPPTGELVAVELDPYEGGRGSLDRHATYIVATFVAGAS